jgi:hypothetical protein
VTRLGEFSPNGQLFTLGSFPKITQVFQNVGLLFSKYRLCITYYVCMYVTKIIFGYILGYLCNKNVFFCYILGYFFTNSSGHPDFYLIGWMRRVIKASHAK